MVSRSTQTLHALLFVALLAGGASAGSFLARLPLNMTRDVSDPEFKRALLAEMDEVLGSGMTAETKRRVDAIEDSLRPTILSLPKNAYGKLDPPAVRYALRRLFMRRQGWSISGLEPTGDAFDPSKASLILEDHAPEIVQEVFKKHMGMHGSGLHEVAILAAIMEQLIFEDMIGKLQQAYKAKEIQPEETVSRAQATSLISLHMAGFIRARDVSEWTPEQVERFEKLIYALYPNWPETLKLMLEVQDRVAPDLEQWTFDDVASVASEVGSQFAHWQNAECQNTKGLIRQMEDGDTGRVRLVDFYNAALYKGIYQFTETITYLRQIGTLDESDELNPKVIIPNYINGRSNCVARTSYYSVCCIDECEDLFGALERQLGKPSATLEEIASAVQGLSSSSRSFANGLPDVHRRRLAEVATHHGGLVPLHGRLFAQWLHLAYPNECAYPHISGTVNYQAMEDWEVATGERSGSTMEELEEWSNRLSQLGGTDSSSTEATKDKEEGDDHLCGMWSMEEELVVAHKTSSEEGDGTPEETTQQASSSSSLALVLKGGGLLAVALAWLYMSGKRPSGKASGSLAEEKYCQKWCV